jgi:TonB family protein
MGDFPLPSSSGAGVLSLGIAPHAAEPAQVQPTESSRDVALLGVLREAAQTGPLSTDSMLNALADAARVLTGADGTALASRRDGVIVCRARSGEMAPSLGAPLNADSGISGECLRTGAIQICNDASTDNRVDSEACRALGIQSVAVVPLRGRMGMFGILEAFSARASAFENDQIDSLRSLAEIAEMSYERERNAANPAPPAPTLRAALFPAAANTAGTPSSGRSSAKLYWIIGCIAFAVLAMGWIARMSWRQTGAEIAASAAAPQPSASAPVSPSIQVIPKPDPAIPARHEERAPKSVVENAADIEVAPETASSPTSARGASLSEVSVKSQNVDDTLASEPPPPVQTAISNLPDEMPKLASETAALPQFGGTVSQGIVPATLVTRVNPQYPMQARSHGIGGDVVLDTTIAANGSVRTVAVVSGPVILRDAAVNAVRQWRFSPALLNGKPVEIQKRVTLVFKVP